MEEKEKELLAEFTKMLALGLGILAWYLLADKDINYKKGVMQQIKDSISSGIF